MRFSCPGAEGMWIIVQPLFPAGDIEPFFLPWNLIAAV